MTYRQITFEERCTLGLLRQRGLARCARSPQQDRGGGRGTGGRAQRSRRYRSPLPGIEDEIGNLLFAVVNLARKLEVDPRTALQKANEKFRSRFEQVERLAEQRGLEIGRASLEELDRLWDECKTSRHG